MNRTPGSLLQELLEDLIARREELEQQLKQSNGVDAQSIMDKIELIDQAVNDPKSLATPQDGVEGPMVTGDPLIDRWEAELFQGKTPDLSGGPVPRQRR